MMMRQDTLRFEPVDIAIVGGGVVGCALALGLEPLGLNIALVEPVPFQAEPDHFDIRQIALSLGSMKIFQAMGLWSMMQPFATDIQHIHVSQAQHLGSVHLDAQEEQHPALGYVVELSKMHAVLLAALKKTSVQFYCPFKVTTLECADDKVMLHLKDHHTERCFSAATLIAADGAQSFVRNALNIGADVHDYHQRAIVANIGLKRHHDNIAYERFYACGPLALLPLGDKRMSLVWTHNTHETDAIMTDDDDAFLARLQKTFGYRAGRFVKVGKRQVFPLTRITSRALTKGRVLFMGSAANHLHPVAGQGLNMALRDIATFCHIQHEAVTGGFTDDIHRITALYEAKRHKDHQKTRQLTHGFVRAFSNDWFVLSLINGFMLRRLERLPAVKKWLNNKMIGLDKPEGGMFFGRPLCQTSNKVSGSQHVDA